MPDPSAADKMYPGGPSNDLGNQSLGAHDKPSLKLLPPEEWEAWRQMAPKSGNVYAPKHGTVPLTKMLEDNPDGFVVDKGHKGLREIQDQAEFYWIPGDQDHRDSDLFVRPKLKPALTS